MSFFFFFFAQSINFCVGASDQHLRRKEQNRAAQRAFRERKERYVKELEDKIRDLCAAHSLELEQLRRENEELRSALKAANNKYETEEEKEDSERFSTPPPDYCVRDKDGVSFCEKLKEEVCSNAYNQLLTEPLFDAQGCLNETVTEHPVPIVTSIMKRSQIFNQMEKSLVESLAENTDSEEVQDSASDDLISCTDVWKELQTHPLFDKFDIDNLCAQLKKKAMCSQSGPVFSKFDIKIILKSIEEKVSSSS